MKLIPTNYTYACKLYINSPTNKTIIAIIEGKVPIFHDNTNPGHNFSLLFPE